MACDATFLLYFNFLIFLFLILEIVLVQLVTPGNQIVIFNYNDLLNNDLFHVLAWLCRAVNGAVGQRIVHNATAAATCRGLTAAVAMKCATILLADSSVRAFRTLVMAASAVGQEVSANVKEENEPMAHAVQ